MKTKITSFTREKNNFEMRIQTGTTENGFEVISTDNLLKFPIVVKGLFSFDENEKC
jgi:hypothetical protein